jgi:hypothetical protein
MSDDTEKIEKAINILQKIAKGINPVTGEHINDESVFASLKRPKADGIACPELAGYNDHIK